MHLTYLLFDATDDDAGACSFDAMAAVAPARLAPLLAEISTVLAWAHGEFGAPSAGGDENGWDYDLQAVDDGSAPLPIRFDGRQAHLAPPPQLGGRITVTLTVSGPAAFAHAFRQAFPD
jgi:hypothetical protein